MLDNQMTVCIFVQMYTGVFCPYCSRSAPSLNEFYKKYHDQGLEIIGILHPGGDYYLDASNSQSRPQKNYLELQSQIEKLLSE